MKHRKLYTYIGTIACAFLIMSGTAHATTLYLDPGKGSYGPGDTFIMTVRIDNEGECINAAEVDLAYSADALRVVDFSKGESIFSLWVGEPTFNAEKGTISFGGGIPGGYCGRITGDMGLTNGLLKIVFRVPSFTVNVAGSAPATQAKVMISGSSRVYLNDGLGGQANVKTKGSTIAIVHDGTSEHLKNEWYDTLKDDVILPEPFDVEIRKDPALFDGKSFLIFSTTDKQSGLDHYEVLEVRKGGFLADTTKRSEWHVATSPYRLADQQLLSAIRVKVIDKAGNERIVEFALPEEQNAERIRRRWISAGVGAGVAVMAAVGVGMWLRRRKKRREMTG